MGAETLRRSWCTARSRRTSFAAGLQRRESVTSFYVEVAGLDCPTRSRRRIGKGTWRFYVTCTPDCAQRFATRPWRRWRPGASRTTSSASLFMTFIMPGKSGHCAHGCGHANSAAGETGEDPDRRHNSLEIARRRPARKGGISGRSAIPRQAPMNDRSCDDATMANQSIRKSHTDARQRMHRLGRLR